jgi:hypothetical protein
MSTLSFRFEHLGNEHVLDLDGALNYFVSDAIAHPLETDRLQLIASLVAYCEGGSGRAEMARAGMRVAALGRERFASNVPAMVDIRNIQPSDHIEIATLEASSEFVPYEASRAPEGAVPAPLVAGIAIQRSHQVAVLSNARINVGQLGQAVFDNEGRHIDGVCRADGLLLAAANIPVQKTFDGSLVSLCSPWSNEYFHWLLEAVPKLLMIECAGHRLIDIDLFMVRQKSPALMEFLNHLGVPDNKVFESHIAPNLQVKRLFVTSSLEHYDHSRMPLSIKIEPWLSRLMCKRFGLPGSASTRRRRIYIDRESARYRKVINSAEVKSVLQEYDVDYYSTETLSLEQKQTIFANASAVIGPVGAGFTNLIFCQPGCAVLIFCARGFEQDSFWSLCNNNGLYHYHLLAEPSGRYFPSEHSGTQNESLLIDITVLRRTLDFLFSQ